MTTLLIVIALTLIGGLMFELHERRAERLERLNRESWEVLRTARRIHDEAAEALKQMFEEARQQSRATRAREIEK
jgi:flagellar motor switch protein FliM